MHIKQFLLKNYQIKIIKKFNLKQIQVPLIPKIKATNDATNKNETRVINDTKSENNKNGDDSDDDDDDGEDEDEDKTKCLDDSDDENYKNLTRNKVWLNLIKILHKINFPY